MLKGRPTRLALAVALVAAAPFLPILANGWVSRDDRINFLDNPYYRGLGPDQVRWAATTFFLGVYQPLAWLILGAEYEIWGLAAWGYHLTSLALHAANAVAFLAMASEIAGRCLPRSGPDPNRGLLSGAAAGAILFAVHPQRVEVVAWVSCQPYLPCALFAMLSIVAYLRGDRASPSGRLAWLSASWASYVAALLCKAPVLPLPAVLLILDAYPLARFSGRPPIAAIAAAVGEKVPFAMAAAAFVAATVGARYVSDPALVTEADLGPAGRIARAGDAAAFYAAKTAWPSDISTIYEWPASAPGLAAHTAGLLVVIAATLATPFFARSRPGLAATWCAFLVAILPVSGLVRSGFVIVADRYAYIATLPLYVAAACGLSRLAATAALPRRWKAWAWAAVVLAASISAGLTWRQCGAWKDDEALALRDASVGAVSRPSALLQIGQVREDQRRLGEAEALYREAARAGPDRPDAANHLGAFLMRTGRRDEGIAWFERAVAIEPRFAVGWNNLGMALAWRERPDEAARAFDEALRIHPYYAEARLNLASVRRGQGRRAEAAELYASVLRHDPANPRARAGLASVLGGSQAP